MHKDTTEKKGTGTQQKSFIYKIFYFRLLGLALSYVLTINMGEAAPDGECKTCCKF